MTAAIVLSGAVPAAGASGPVLVAEPATDLLDGHPVRTRATGLTSGASYTIVQCRAAPAEGCAAPSGGGLPHNVAFVKASPNGAASAELRVERDLRPGGGTTVHDCTPGGCVVALLDAELDPLVSVPISFAAEGTYQWAPAQLTATPSTGLVERQPIALAAVGLDPRYAPLPPAQDPTPAAFVDVCRAVEDPGPDDCLDGDEAADWSREPVFYVETDPDGTAEGTFRVHRFLPLPGGTVDCAVEACTVAVDQGGNPVSNRVPLSFGPEWAPYPSAGAFLDALVVVRGGAFTADQRSALAAALAARTTTGADALADAARHGSSATGGNRLVAEVARIYRAYFGRYPETGGLGYWVGRMERGLSSAEVGRLFGGTPEFRATYGTSSNAAVVDRAYRNTLGRAPEPSGLAYWTSRLDQGLPRWKMIHGFARSPEMATREQDRTAITVMVWALLGRAPTSHELAGSPQSLLPGAGSVRDVAVDLLASGDLP